MDNFSPARSPKKKYSAAIIAVIVCVAIVAGAVAIAILNPEGGFDILPPFTGESRQKTHFSEIEYRRPDTEKLADDLDTLIEMIEAGNSFTEQRSLYNRINLDYSTFLTMMNLANINYSADTSSELYFEELSLLENAYITIQNKLNLLHDTIAHSSFKTNYERSYYGVGYFTDWVDLVYPDEVTALMEKENSLIADYRSLLSDPFIELDGITLYINRDLESLSERDYYRAFSEYYKKYNPLAGEIYVSLVKTRLEIAELLETSYAEHAYSGYDRDYTPDDARKYLEGISKTVIPVIEQVDYDASYILEFLDPSDALYALSHGTGTMDGVIDEAFDYMFELGLYDIGASPVKSRSSFTTFLYDYGIPYLFVSSQRTASDFFTLSHEFGHFVDSYYNQSFSAGIDASEICSRAMEYIMPYYTDTLRGFSTEDLREYSVYTALEIYTTQSYISSFEDRVYSLSADEVTLERLNAIAKESAENFGLSAVSDVYGIAWIDIPHIYEAPFYTISYIVSNDVALQVLEAELSAPGSGGVEAFLKTIDRDEDLSFIEEITASGFKSPFDGDRLDKIADIIKDTLTDPELPAESSADETTSEETLAIPAA